MKYIIEKAACYIVIDVESYGYLTDKNISIKYKKV